MEVCSALVSPASLCYTSPQRLENIAATTDPELIEELATHLHELHTCFGGECRTIKDKPFAR
jgi:hypothetical protein